MREEKKNNYLREKKKASSIVRYVYISHMSRSRIASHSHIVFISTASNSEHRLYPAWKDGVVSIRLRYKILKVIGHRCYCLSAVTMCPDRHDFVIPRWTISQISARPTDLFSFFFLFSLCFVSAESWRASDLGFSRFVLATYIVLYVCGSKLVKMNNCLADIFHIAFSCNNDRRLAVQRSFYFTPVFANRFTTNIITQNYCI